MTDQATHESGGVLDPQRSLAFLAQVSIALARSLDYERTLAEVAQLAVPEFADWCAVDIVQPDGSLRQITSGHPDPRMEELLMDLRRRYRAEKGQQRGRHARHRQRRVRAGHGRRRASLASSIDEDDGGPSTRPSRRARTSSSPWWRAAARSARSPSCRRSAGRHYGPTDLDFAEHLARRFGLAVDNARLYQDAENARDRLTFIADGQ